MPPTPTLSIVVVFFNMRREAQRSLLSLRKRYQLGVADLDYEVICIDNGSAEPLSPELVESFGPQFRYRSFATQSPSPAAAINFGVSQARGEHVMIIPDGANILTPRIFQYTLNAIREHANPLVAAVGFALGAATQQEVATWDQAAEDRRLASVDWLRDGYELFRLTNSFRDNAAGWFGCQYESTCFTMRKSSFQDLGGFDAAFRSPGGGLVSLDFFQRAVARPELEYIVLLGEATFHQFHGGAASGATDEAEHPWERFHAEYRSIRGEEFQRVARLPIYLGQFPPQALKIAGISATHGFEWWRDTFK